MNSTIYNGSHVCTRCGGHINPLQAMVDKKLCADCRRAQHADQVSKRMA